MSHMRRLFVPITKVDATQRMIYGVAALEQEDKSGEIFDYASSKPYVQEWSNELSAATGGRNLGNVRAMHGKVAAGHLQDLQFNDDDKQIEVGAKITDANEWNKVQEGTYTGFSIGGDYVKRWKDDDGKYRYTAKLSEVSIVDNPAMPGAHFTMVKSAGAEETRSFAKYATAEEFTGVTITNNQVVARAQQIAKAAGSDKFADFITQARDELVKEAGGNPAGDAAVAVPLGGGAHIKPSSQATITEVTAGVANNATDNDATVTAGDAAHVDQAVTKPGEPGNTGNNELRDGANAPTHPDFGGKAASPTNVDPRNEVQQGWQAKDGSFHVTKAAALAHNSVISDPTITAFNAAMGKAAAAVAEKKGDPNNSPKINQEEKDKAKKGTNPENMGEAESATSKAADAPGDGSKPYGDVKYADPGYKADKKKRYPVDTEQHVRAAWSYIHKPKNHTGYTSAQVDKIKSNIVAAWKDVIGGEPPAADAKKAFAANTLRKGMGHVARLAHMIEELNWLQDCCEMEEQWEKDGSAVPAQLKGDIASLVGTLKNMLDEEAAELFDENEVIVFADVLEMAAHGIGADVLEKCADYFGNQPLNKANTSVSTVHALLKAASVPKEHKGKVQEMHDHCVAMGAKCADGGAMAGKAAGMEGTMSKADGDRISAENAMLREMLTKSTSTMEKMAADIQAIKDQPVVIPPGRLSIVEKGAMSGEAASASDLLKHFTPEQLSVAAIRMSQEAGGHKIFGPGA